MRIAILVVLCCICGSTAYSQQSIEGLLKQLRETKQKAIQYDKQKEHRIDSLRKLLRGSGDPAQYFDYCILLNEEYKSYKYDSAYQYGKLLQAAASNEKNGEKLIKAKLKLGFSLLSAGLFKEASELLNEIHPLKIPDTLKPEYFIVMGRLYYDMADFGNDSYHSKDYNSRGSAYIDSAINQPFIRPFDKHYFEGLRDIRLGNNEQAAQIFRSLLAQPSLTDHEIALTASTLSDIYIKQNLTDSAIILLTKAAIADIKSSTKETAAAFNLATVLYRRGDVKNASFCIQLALDDAGFYGARQRKVRLSDILPLIEGEKLNMVEKQKSILIVYLAIATLLLGGVIVLIFIVRRQLRKLQQAQKMITAAHHKEQEINHRLMESNKIKEEYIGYFFNANSEFYEKIERFKRSLEQKVADRRIDDVKFLVNNFNLKAEKEYTLQDFDRIFLKLFPNFIKEFNSLFAPEDAIQLKDEELLNTNLRIFALIRIGIHDNEKIARILQYSVHTINTYKTKIKNKSIVSNEEFEKKIMEIKTI